MRIKKRTAYIILSFLLIIAAAFLFIKYLDKSPYGFKGDKFFYSNNRGDPWYESNLMNKTESMEVYLIKYKSRDFLSYPVTIYGLLFMPLGKKDAPGIVLLPGGGVKKEAESTLARELANRGYAVLTIDQRGIGETGSYYLGIEEDYKVFLTGKEPIQHLSVYDALRAYDVLKDIGNVKKENIAVAGESMGGRYAIIAGAVEKRFKGVVAISASGFHIKKDNSPENPYLLSIDPDHYIPDISPRPLFMLHGDNDSNIKLADAEFTFSIAKEPKKFFIAEGCGHGYCDKMNGAIKEAFEKIFQR